MKIHEISKQLGVTSKEVIEKANQLGIKATSHLNVINKDDVKLLIKSFNTKQNSKDTKKEVKEDKKAEIQKKENTKSKKMKNENIPVIIRREVIVNDEQEKKEEKNLRSKRADVGFVERDKNKDYNIVYRNKPEKPLTANELFGLKNRKSQEKSEKAMPSKQVEKQEKIEERKDSVIEEKKENKTYKENNYNRPNNFEKSNRSNNAEKENRFNNRQNSQDGRSNNRFGGQDGRTTNKYSSQEGGSTNRFGSQDGRSTNRYGSQDGRSTNRYGSQDGRPNNRFGSQDNKSNNRFPNKDNRFNNRNQGNNQNNQYQRNNYSRGNRPLDEKGIDKNIKDIMSVEIGEKEIQRDYSTRVIDKEKQNKFEETKASNVKRTNKNKKTTRFESFDEGKLKKLKQVDKLSNMFNEQDGGMLDYYDLTTERGKRNRKKIRNNEDRNKQKIFELTEISIPEIITVKDLASELKKTSAEVIKKIFNYGIMATLNNELDFDTAFLVAEEFGVKAIKKEVINEEDILFDESEDKDNELVKRPPVVVVMGHVDHGKTSLLDAIRSANVIEGEAGGITQHIGAYMVTINERDITFLDTPGHEAFTSMRARGAQITDVAILVVAADDGVMPQTIEAINHAKSANIPIIVAVNKIDLPDANVEKIKQELMQYELVSEEWGGDTIFVPISAKNGTNIENLLEMVLLVSDMKELKVNPNKQAKGTIIEARLDKAKGPIASVLVQRGTLDIGDTVVVGTSIGRIRAMKNDKGQNVKYARPSMPVEIMGLTEVPEAGDTFYEVKNEKIAKHLIEKRRNREREKSLNNSNIVTLDNLFEKMETEDLKQLNLIVKADVQGTAEAVKQSLEKLSNDEVKVKVIHAIVGAVTESDVQLAKAASAIIIAFNVRPVITAKMIAEKDGVEIKQYSIIYKAIEDIESAMKGMLDPIYEEKVIGNVEVRQIFKVSSIGTIAGCYVIDGKIERNAGVRVIRNNVVIHEGKLESLKRFKDDVKEVAKGYECGIQIEKYNDLIEGDIIEVFIMEEVKR